MRVPRVHFVAASACTALLAALVPTVVSAQQAAAETARDCINNRLIEYTKPLGGHSIIFFMHGRLAYQNMLLEECPALHTEDMFTYRSLDSMQHLCKGTLINVFATGAPAYPVAACTLGAFAPIDRDEAKQLLAAAPPASKKTGKQDSGQPIEAQPVDSPQVAQPRSQSAEPPVSPESRPSAQPAAESLR